MKGMIDGVPYEESRHCICLVVRGIRSHGGGQCAPNIQ